MRLALIASAALVLSACATAPTNEGKGLSAAQDAVASACAGAHQAYVAGVITKADVQKAAALCDKADDASKAARAAYASGDATTYAGALAQLTALTAQIVAIKGAAK